MNIVKLSGHACIRVHKMAIPLIARGHNVHIVSTKMPSFADFYRTVTCCVDANQFVDAVKLYAKTADIFHAHNEPSWFVTMVKEACDIPVVLDVHDSYLARVTPEADEQAKNEGKYSLRITTEERNNFQLADALVFPSEPFRDAICGEFKLTQPALVLPSYLPETLYRYDCREWFGGLVYEGRVDTPEEVKSNKFLAGFEYCEYTDLAKECHRFGIPFHVYAPRKDNKLPDIYGDTAIIQEPVGIDKLIYKISRHDWGLVGNVNVTPEWNVAFPNKLFEYMAACVPIVAINAPECSRFIEKHKIGITVGSIEELSKRWAEHRECRMNLIKVRKRFTMDEHIGKLEDLYRSVL